MFLRLLKGVFSIALLTALPAIPSVAQTTGANNFEDIRIELPSRATVRIENQYGDVAAEVWKEKYISVSATVEGSREFARSPVVIENRALHIGIRIIRRPGDPAVAINLAVKLPEYARVEIVTGKGSTSMQGVTSSSSVRSLTGNIRVQFSESVDADIIARSITGVIRSELPQLISDKGHVLQARLGTGAQTLRINTQRGDISLSLATTDVLGKSRLDEPSTPDVPLSAAGTPAPAVETQEISEGDIIRVDSQLVTLNMSVIDRKTNRGLVGLTKSDFRLFENGTEQQILQFESSSAPFDLLLLIDLSGSTRDVVKLIRSAALRFVDAARPSDRIGVITFAGRPAVVSPLTLNRRMLHERVNAMDTSAGDTKLYDALDFAISHLLQDAKTSRRTAIVVMSDGLDGTIPGVNGQQGSRLPYRDLLSRVREFDGVLYTLWLDTYYEALNPRDTQPEAFEMGHDRMKEMAEAGGGIFYEVIGLEDLAGAYERVVADLGTVYSLAYRPSDKTRDGTWRAIRVDVNRPSAVARGKRGYYAN
ncbi:MAG: VWA domain-containing protein [Pyrinomonadaceae bacterium]